MILHRKQRSRAVLQRQHLPLFNAACGGTPDALRADHHGNPAVDHKLSVQTLPVQFLHHRLQLPAVQLPGHGQAGGSQPGKQPHRLPVPAVHGRVEHRPKLRFHLPQPHHFLRAAHQCAVKSRLPQPFAVLLEKCFRVASVNMGQRQKTLFSRPMAGLHGSWPPLRGKTGCIQINPRHIRLPDGRFKLLRFLCGDVEAEGNGWGWGGRGRRNQSAGRRRAPPLVQHRLLQGFQAGPPQLILRLHRHEQTAFQLYLQIRKHKRCISSFPQLFENLILRQRLILCFLRRLSFHPHLRQRTAGANAVNQGKFQFRGFSLLQDSPAVYGFLQLRLHVGLVQIVEQLLVALPECRLLF